MTATEILRSRYGITPSSLTKLNVGAGSETYDVRSDAGRFILKNPSESEMNDPLAEPELCEHLLNKGLPVSEFIRTSGGEFIASDENRVWHLQRFVEGTCFGWNEAPEWLVEEQPRMLGRIHAALDDYKRLGDGIGEQFFKFMTPERALASYENTMKYAEAVGDADIAADLRDRIGIVSRFPDMKLDINRFTRKNTHGDYFISQLICGDGKINAVIDWTTACYHPAAWEIIRSYIYSAPECADGTIDDARLAAYTARYEEYSPLNDYDRANMVNLYLYQISVCDYYAQYYGSKAGNRHIYLDQAVFATKVMKKAAARGII